MKLNSNFGIYYIKRFLLINPNKFQLFKTVRRAWAEVDQLEREQRTLS